MNRDDNYLLMAKGMSLTLCSKKLTTLRGIPFDDGLRYINVSFNRLTNIDGALFPEGLRKLSLSYNKLIRIDCAKLPKGLQELYLKDNKLVSLEGVSRLTELQTLTLSDNRLTDLDDVHFPESLKSLDLENNPLARLECVQFPEGVERPTFSVHKVIKSENLYISPTTLICKFRYINLEHILRLASNQTCVQAIFQKREIDYWVPGAWWIRVSYMTGGITFQEVDQAFS